MAPRKRDTRVGQHWTQRKSQCHNPLLHPGDRFEVDHPAALVVRDGVAVYIGPGGVPVLFDHEGVSQFIGDLMLQPNG